MRQFSVALVFVFTLFFGTMVQAQDATMNTPLCYPQWADGSTPGAGSYYSEITTTSLDEVNSGRLEMTFFDDNGNAIRLETDRGAGTPLVLDLPRGNVVSFTTSQKSPALTSGWLMSKSNVRAGGLLIFHYHNGRKWTRVSVVPADPRHAFTIPVRYFARTEAKRVSTGIALANPSDAPTSVILTLSDRFNVKVAEKTVQLSRFGHTSLFVEDIFKEYLGSVAVAQFEGKVEGKVTGTGVCAMSVGFDEDFLAGEFTIDNAPALAATFQNPSELMANSVPVFYLNPSDLALDVSYQAGVRFVLEDAKEALDIECARAGFGTCSALKDFERDPATARNEIKVNLVAGPRPSAAYEADPSLILADVFVRYPQYAERDILIVSQANISQDVPVLTTMPTPAGKTASIFSGPQRSKLNNSFANFTESYIRNPDDRPRQGVLTKGADVTLVELAGLRAFSTVQGMRFPVPGSPTTPNGFVDLLSSVPDNGESGLGLQTAGLRPNVRTFGLRPSQLFFSYSALSELRSRTPKLTQSEN